VKNTFEREFKSKIHNLQLDREKAIQKATKQGKQAPKPVTKSLKPTSFYGFELYDRLPLLGDKPATTKRTLKPLIDKYKVKLK